MDPSDETAYVADSACVAESRFDCCSRAVWGAPAVDPLDCADGKAGCVGRVAAVVELDHCHAIQG